MIHCLRASKRPGPEETAVHANKWELQGHLEPLPIHLFRGTHFTALRGFPGLYCCGFTFSEKDKKQGCIFQTIIINSKAAGPHTFLHLIHPNAMPDFIRNPCALLIAKETPFPRCQYSMTSDCHSTDLLHPRKYIHRRDGPHSDAAFLTLPKWPKSPKVYNEVKYSVS